MSHEDAPRRVLYFVFAQRDICRTRTADCHRGGFPGGRTGGHIIKDTYAIDTSEESRLVEVRFSRPIAWQMVDESFTSGDDYEVREDNFAIQVLTKSRYLDYVRENHGWFEEMCGPGKQYRIWTENEVIDVVACEPPTVALTEGTPSESN